MSNVSTKHIQLSHQKLRSIYACLFCFLIQLTYADIRFFSSMNLLFQEIKEDIPPVLDNYPALKDLYNTVRSNAGIKEWLSKLPEKK